MKSPAEQLLAKAVEFHKVNDLTNAVPIYNQLLSMEPFNPGVLYLMGDAAVRQGCCGLAINLLTNAISVKPTVEAFTALGCAYKAEGFTEEALNAWREGLVLGDSAELHNNIASVYADSGRPTEALGHIDAALAYDPNNPHALWNRALANLTQQNWPQGWEDHEHRFNRVIQSTSYRRDYGCPIWDGAPGLRLAIHGEQGIGDEIMFMSMLREALNRCPDAVIEVEPRLMDIVAANFDIPVYGTEKAMKAHEKPFQAAIPLGSLGRIFRQSIADFPGTQYLRADPERVVYWRRQYAMQGPGPYIGVAWQGGSKSTRIQERTIKPAELKFAKRGTAISLQYGDFSKEGAQANGYLFWPESNGRDMNEQFAMVAACDLIITTPQTLVHVAGSLGVECHVLVPRFPSWRYGIAETMPWYNSVHLHRQRQEGNWAHPLAEAKKAVDKACREKEQCN